MSGGSATKVVLGGESPLRLEEVFAVALDGAEVELAPAGLERAARAARFVREQAESGRIIYGVTTGFGANSNQVVPLSDMQRLQANLLMSHACGVGAPFPTEVVRAMLCLRVNALLTEHSGATPTTLAMLAALLNRRVHPIVPSQGSVGASGDLCPLAHMCLPLIGLGEVEHEGRRWSGAEALELLGSTPLELSYKEGIALLNGTQAQAALGVVAAWRARRLVELAEACCAMSMDALCGRTDAFDDRLQRLRRHAGQSQSAARLRWWLEGSELAGCDPALLGGRKVDLVQDPYCLRCAPQVHGAARGVLAHVEAVLSEEINAVTDNPVLFPDDGDIVSGGNFHGEPVAMVLDYLKLGVAELGNISDRRCFKLLTPSLSEGLPAFLVEQPGLNSGMMIMQYVTAALVSENKVLAHPASVDSIPTSANKEDLVAMGTQSGMQLLQMEANVERVLSIELILAAQALDMRERMLGRRAAPRVAALRDRVREVVPFLEQDQPMSPHIEAVHRHVVCGAGWV